MFKFLRLTLLNYSCKLKHCIGGNSMKFSRLSKNFKPYSTNINIIRDADKLYINLNLIREVSFNKHKYLMPSACETGNGYSSVRR